jgi:signal peptidase II
MLRGHGLRLVLLAAMAGTIGCDRVTKHVATATLAGGADHSWLGDTVRLTYAENPGAFLGLGADWPAAVRTTVFALAALAGVAVVGTLWRRLAHAPAAVFGLALFAAGSLSNLVDRLAYGRVVDFLNVGIGPVRTGIFNVADVAILAGAALVVVFSRKSIRTAQPPALPPYT